MCNIVVPLESSATVSRLVEPVLGFDSRLELDDRSWVAGYQSECWRDRRWFVVRGKREDCEDASEYEASDDDDFDW